MRAMARLGAGPVRTAEVAAELGKSPQSLSPVRESLIRRAMCYVPDRGELAFTVPLFDEFMKRRFPDAG